ncbi:response regulator [Paenibacillus sp. BC26]|uniref:response regulator transcription factor n=1 Tax=Paenibacillus sp. BC26 TaxID=1881032 RepID=UPI0008E6E033|nr:response regulator [Paenibacillus sp. BC26]SFT06502.1 two component transcriptional regulator, AraC family [Paenibacillus sp. BC26]
MKIMIVDDEQFIRLGLEKIISKSDETHDVIGSFSNGQEAWNFLLGHESQEPDVLITDIKMPMMDGLKLSELVREKYKNITIIILSGFSDFEYARSALRFGVRDYLLKPVDKSALFDLLGKIRLEKSAVSEVSAEDGAQLESDHYIIEQMKDILDREYDKNFELERLADSVGMNASYISRLFKHKTSMTITDYLIQLRIEKAKQFLADHPHLKNYEISHLVGYSDPVYFNKLFKKMVGVTPKDYKDKHRWP